MLAVLSNYLYVPRALTEPHHFDNYTYRLTDTHTKDRYTVETFEERANTYAFPSGNLAKLQRLFGAFQWADRRVTRPLDYQLRFMGRLTSEQESVVAQWLSLRYGMIQAPPRWGKSLVMTALLCRLNERTLMVAHLEDLCHQLEETIRRFTNVNELEEQAGRKLVGVLDEWTDFFPIATLSTYQCFAVSPRGKQVLREHRDDFGLVMVDEAHRCTTELYTEVIGRTTAAYRCGVTATPRRKDGMHVVVEDVLGPVVAVGKGEQLSVQYTFESTDIKVQSFSNWSTMWNRLVKVKTRNQKIAQRVVEDVQAGHFVLVTTERLRHLDDLQVAIQAIDPDITIGLLSSKTRDREKFRNDCKRGRYQVVIAMNKIVELGYNIPRWSCFHNTLPMANRPNWYQRISRIRTPMEPAFPGDTYQKPPPLARIWVDYGHKAVYAYKSLVKAENNRLGFECLNPDPPRRQPKRGRRSGLIVFDEVPDASDQTDRD